MTLLAPIWLLVGAVAALGVLALHFIARQRPAPMLLPTARFIPDLPARAASRARRPTDLLLLALRALAALLLGLAFAGPVLRPARVPLVRVVMLDRSGAIGQPDSAGALARALLREGDVLVAFDTVAAVLEWTNDAPLPEPHDAPADLATALLEAFAAARDVSARADSIELVLVSPIDSAAWSKAVLPVRAEWPGAIRIERVPELARDSLVESVTIRSAPDDPLAATVALLGRSAAVPASVRVLRAVPTAADSAWARDSGGVLVSWPAAVADSSDLTTGRGSAGAVIAGEVVAVAPWSRGVAPRGRPVAWWVDGGVAATEASLGSGCVREVAIGVPDAGDIALAASTQRLVRALTAPCGIPARLGPVADSLVRRLAGSAGLLPGTRIVRAGVQDSPATPWLLAAALMLLLIEWLVRSRIGRA